MRRRKQIGAQGRQSLIPLHHHLIVTHQIAGAHGLQGANIVAAVQIHPPARQHGEKK